MSRKESIDYNDLWPKLEKETVNHPDHYNSDGIECIDAMIASQGVDDVRAFCICNAFKYIWRYQSKNGIEDIKKAIWYLNKFVELGNDVE